MRPAFVSLLAALCALPALAADLPRAKAPAAPALASVACKESDAVPPDAFGFAAGSDVAEGLNTASPSGRASAARSPMGSRRPFRAGSRPASRSARR